MVHNTVIFHLLSTCWPRVWQSLIWPSWTDLIYFSIKTKNNPVPIVLFTIYLFLLILEHNTIDEVHETNYHRKTMAM